MYALNFYSPLVADQLRSGRKSATIRLGDKSGKYKKGMVVRVLCGVRFSPREHVFDAVIDKVEVKTLGELSPREIEHDNPEIRRTEEMATFLGQLYNREVSDDDTEAEHEARVPRTEGLAHPHQAGEHVHRCREEPDREARLVQPDGRALNLMGREQVDPRAEEDERRGNDGRCDENP